MQKKKLTLNKQKITKLTKDQSASIQGGGSQCRLPIFSTVQK